MVALSTIEALREAMRAERLVSVVYNRGRSMLAPYTIFSRYGDEYIRAITAARDGREPRRLKFGTFKVAAFGDLQVTQVTFAGGPLFRRTAPREA